MKSIEILISITIVAISLITACGEKDEETQLECNTYDVGKNAIMESEESDTKCVYGTGNYNLLQDSFDEPGESIRFQLNGDFTVTFTTYESYYDGTGAYVNKSNGVFEVGEVYTADARTGNATFFSEAKLEIESIDKENKLISGKITGQAPIRWVDATPVMGYIIFTFVDFKI